MLGNFTPHCGGGGNVSLEDKGVTMATTQLWEKQGGEEWLQRREG